MKSGGRIRVADRAVLVQLEIIIFNEGVANSENNGQHFLLVLFSRARRGTGIYEKRMEAEN